jgi:P-type E1-E2 ATPase
MSVRIDIPGGAKLELEHLLLDVNGTLSERGRLLAGMAERIARLRLQLELQLVSADTFGTLAEIASELGVPAQVVASAQEKLELIDRLGSARCAAIGNGANDAAMLSEAALGIAVLGPEGTSSAACAAADIVCRSGLEALDLLLEPRMLAATLRP